ncbi:MAG: tetratricopeptide (TPR) repeat protein [Planctomycetota bacterium]|jgi:tetratricopeptide (TPR) repeat protein
MVMGGCGSDLLVKGPYMRGVDHYDAGDSKSAIIEYQAALVDKPEDHRVHYNMALCFHDLFLQAKDAGDTDGSAKYLIRAEDAYKNSEKLTDLKARAQVARAKLLWDTEDKARMSEAIEMLAGIKGDDGTGEAMPIWTRATMLSSQGNKEAAGKAYEEALTADENYLPALTALAEMRIVDGQLSAAQELVKKGLKRNKHDVTLLAMNARIAQVEASSNPSPEKWQECMTRWRLVEALSSTDWEALYGIANCAQKLGQNQLAVRYYWHCRDHASDFALSRRDQEPEEFREDIRQQLLRLYPLLKRGE